MKFKRNAAIAALIVTGAAAGGAIVESLNPVRPNEAHAVSSAPTVPLPAGDPIASNPNIYVSLARRAVPSIVNIQTLSTEAPQMHPGFLGNPWGPFGQFGMNPYGATPRYKMKKRSSPARPVALGTGFIIEKSGDKVLILTNNHVIERGDQFRIQFTESPDEKPTEGRVTARDADLDVALIEVKTTRDVKPLPFGDSDQLEVGEYVMAVGNPFGQGHSVSHGIISAKGRASPDFPLMNYLQTDAPINPGNSGGPLINLAGQVIGINNAIDARGSGIGFAIPSNAVNAILAQLKAKGKVDRGYLGVLLGSAPATEGEEMTATVSTESGPGRAKLAPYVVEVLPNGPADQAGLKKYDRVLEWNGKPMSSQSELVGAVAALSAGDRVAVKISRKGKIMSLEVKLANRPDPKEFAQQDFEEESG